jgi:hypothetical protein
VTIGTNPKRITVNRRHLHSHLTTAAGAARDEKQGMCKSAAAINAFNVSSLDDAENA